MNFFVLVSDDGALLEHVGCFANLCGKGGETLVRFSER
jgi:hypothetical protein